MRSVLQRFQGSGRDAGVLRNVAWSLFLKGASVLLALASVPTYIAFFGDKEALGVWFTLLGTLSWILYFDIGVGNGLRNHLVVALEEGRMGEVRGYLASAYLATLLMAVLACVVSLIVVPQVSWNSVFNVSDEVIPPDVLRTAVLITLLGLSAQMFFRTISSILYALQRAALVSLLSVVSTALILCYILATRPPDAPSGLIMLALVYALSVNLPMIVATIAVFTTQLRASRPSVRAFRWSYARDILILGGGFFVLQLTYMVLANTNPFLISWLTSPANVVDFQVYSRPFGAVSSVVALALVPIWSAVTRAIAAGDLAWVGSVYRKLWRVVLLSWVLLAAMVPLMPVFVELWLGVGVVEVDLFYAAAFAVSAGAFVLSGALSSIANGAGEIRIQMLAFGFGAILKFVFVVTLAGPAGSWIWVVLSDGISLLPYLVAQSIWLRRLVAPSSKASSP